MTAMLGRWVAAGYRLCGQSSWGVPCAALAEVWVITGDGRERLAEGPACRPCLAAIRALSATGEGLAVLTVTELYPAARLAG
jgi:hypothetical protein